MRSDFFMHRTIRIYQVDISTSWPLCYPSRPERKKQRGFDTYIDSYMDKVSE
jgi:hypothetical protein